MTKGKAERTCGARTRDGGKCGKPAGWGTPTGAGYCKLHTGATPNGQRVAQLELARQHVEALALPMSEEDSPADVLLEEVRRSAAVVRWLHSRVMDLGEEDMIVDGWPSPWIALWERQRRHLVDTTARAASLRLFERQVHVEEKQGELAGHMVARILRDLGHNLSDPHVREIVTHRFREIAAEAG
jgi:hypothetical protein